MLRIAVVDDDQIAISRLRECLNHYSEEKSVNFNIKVYQNGIDLLVGYRSDYDIIFFGCGHAGYQWFSDRKEDSGA